MNDFTISHLAREANVRVETIRYYERLGILRQPLRRENGYRQYNARDAAQLLFIRKIQALGFTLKEIKQLIEVRLDNKQCCSVVKTLTTNKLADVRRKLLRLKAIESQLHHYCDGCDGPHQGGQCPLFVDMWPNYEECENRMATVSD